MRIHAEVSRLNGRYQGVAAPQGKPGAVTGFFDSADAAWLTLHDAIARVARAAGWRLQIISSPCEPQRRLYIIGSEA